MTDPEAIKARREVLSRGLMMSVHAPNFWREEWVVVPWYPHFMATSGSGASQESAFWEAYTLFQLSKLGIE